MKEKVYIETSIISYLCARTSRDLIQTANQEITREWWKKERIKYDLLISDFVVDEASKGNSEAARRRMELIETISILPLTSESEILAIELVKGHAFPKKAFTDASHVAIASVYNIDYILSWNCKHIVNPHMQNKIRATVESLNYKLPIICTPFELLEEI